MCCAWKYSACRAKWWYQIFLDLEFRLPNVGVGIKLRSPEKQHVLNLSYPLQPLNVYFKNKIMKRLICSLAEQIWHVLRIQQPILYPSRILLGYQLQNNLGLTKTQASEHTCEDIFLNGVIFKLLRWKDQTQIWIISGWQNHPKSGSHQSGGSVHRRA